MMDIKIKKEFVRPSAMKVFLMILIFATNVFSIARFVSTHLNVKSAKAVIISIIKLVLINAQIKLIN